MEKFFSFSVQANKIGDALNHFNSTILCCVIPRKQPLYLGSGKVCVHSTLPRPHLWDFTGYVVVVVVCCVIFCLGITFQEFCSCFSPLFRAILLVCSTPFKKLDNAKTSSNADVDSKRLLEEDAELVLDTLMNFRNHTNTNEVELVEVFDSFDETEPSLEEVQEAFDVFDENGDGYIDANELEKVVSKMGFLELSVLDCQRMIAPFDENKDGKIEFGEFVKLMEYSFQ